MPADFRRLWSTLISDNIGRPYESLDRIQQIITYKVAQIQAAKRWLRLVSVQSLAENPRNYPGTVNWPEEKLHIDAFARY